MSLNSFNSLLILKVVSIYFAMFKIWKYPSHLKFYKLPIVPMFIKSSTFSANVCLYKSSIGQLVRLRPINNARGRDNWLNTCN